MKADLARALLQLLPLFVTMGLFVRIARRMQYELREVEVEQRRQREQISKLLEAIEWESADVRGVPKRPFLWTSDEVPAAKLPRAVVVLGKRAVTCECRPGVWTASTYVGRCGTCGGAR